MVKNRQIRGIVSLLLVWIIAMSVYYPMFARNRIQEVLKGRLEPATVTMRSKSKAQNRLLELARAAEVAPKEHSTYIVRLKSPAVPSYEGGIQGLKATSPLVTKQKKLDVTSSKSRAYMKYLDLEQETIVTKITKAIGRQPHIVNQYRLALNGLAAELTLDEAMAVAALPDVRGVIPDWTEQVQTDAGPIWMSADTLWNGSASGTATQGEGIVVGIIDTGINMDHPSFADIGGDGYNHTNPRGQFYGWCNPADPNYDPTLVCNDKLIGVWSANTSAYGPEDCAGHGSHTASTAAGNFVTNVALNAPTITHNLANRISGVAPHANIIAYNIEIAPCTGLAFGADIIAATEQAIADRVDVINYSFGGSGDNPWGVADHWYNVRAAGIFVATSAGNSGSASDTIGSPANAPWMMTVGASSHNRMFSNVLQNLSGGDTSAPADIQGEGVTSGLPLTRIVYAGAIDPVNEGCDGTYVPDTFSGEIVVCDYSSSGHGRVGRVTKSQNLAKGGAGGFILINREDWGAAVLVDPYAIPGMGIAYNDGQVLKAWLASGTGHQAEIRGVLEEPARGDIMAGFSSRGPNGPLPDVIKPDVTAPGRRIVAAIATDRDNPNPPEFGVYQGTSMSSPHAAGAAALIRALHPDWTPAEVQSALMSTANNTNILKEDGATPAGPFDMGAGRIDLLAAVNAALVLDETPKNLLTANPYVGGDPTSLNLASLGNSRCVGTCTWTRTVKATTAATWSASGTTPAGGTLTVMPAAFSLAAGETQELTVTMDVPGMPVDEWVFGTVVLTPSGGLPTTHFPVAVLPSNGSVPDRMTIRTRRNAGSQIMENVEAISVTDLNIEVDGLVPATLVTQDLDQDSNKSSPYDDLTDGVFYVTVSVPDDALMLVAEIFDFIGYNFNLFVGTGVTPSAATQVCDDSSGQWKESCQITDPEAGDWWILVQNYTASDTPPDSATLAYGVIDDGDRGNLTVSVPDSNSAGEPFDLTVFWNELTMAAGERWYGRLNLGTDSSNPGNIGAVVVVLDRLEDDVSKTVDPSFAKPGDLLTYQITILPNVTATDLVYTLTDTIPAGLTYVPGSAAATDGSVEVTGNILTWTGAMISPIGLAGSYAVTTSADDPLCDTGLGGYFDLETYGTLGMPLYPNSLIKGDDAAWMVNGSVAQVPIQFYGANKTTINLTDDGFLFFDSTSGDEPRTNTDLPDPNDPNDLLAAFWNDMEIVYDGTPGSVRGVTVAKYADVVTIVEYDDLEPWPAGSTSERYDFEVVIWNEVYDSPGLYEIIYAYGPHTGSPASATIGVENSDGTIATKFLYGDPAGIIDEGLMVCFDYQGPHLAPVTITYQATVDEDAYGILTNNVVHTTDNPGSQAVCTSAAVEVNPSGDPTPTPDPGVIPEPASLLLFGLGLLTGAAVFFVRRRRRK